MAFYATTTKISAVLEHKVVTKSTEEVLRTEDQTANCYRSPAHWIMIVPKEQVGLFLGTE